MKLFMIPCAVRGATAVVSPEHTEPERPKSSFDAETFMSERSAGGEGLAEAKAFVPVSP